MSSADCSPAKMIKAKGYVSRGVASFSLRVCACACSLTNRFLAC